MKKVHSRGAKHTVLFLIWSGWMTMYLITMAVNISLPFIAQDLDLDPVEQGILLSFFFLGYGGMQIPSGILSDKYGFRKIMLTGALAWSVFTILFGLSANFLILCLLRLLIGAAQALLPPPGWKAIGVYFPSSERAWAISVQYTAASLGPALATPLVAFIISQFSWRIALLAAALPGFLLAWAIFRLMADDPSKHPHITASEIEALAADKSRIALKAREEIGSGGGRSAVTGIQTSVLWRIVLSWTLQGLVFWAVLGWMPTYLLTEKGFSLSQMGILGALPLIIAAGANMLGGYMSDRARGRRKRLYVRACLIAMTFFLLQNAVNSTAMTIISQSMILAGLSYCSGVFWGIVADFCPADSMGTITATVNFGGQVGGFVSPYVVGYTLKVFDGSFYFVFVIMSLFIFLSAIVTATTETRNELPKPH